MDGRDLDDLIDRARNEPVRIANGARADIFHRGKLTLLALYATFALVALLTWLVAR